MPASATIIIEFLLEGPRLGKPTGLVTLFQVLTASNDSCSGWTKTFTDPRLCAAIVDRLTFGGNIIKTGTDGFRLAHTRARVAAAAGANTPA